MMNSDLDGRHLRILIRAYRAWITYSKESEKLSEESLAEAYKAKDYSKVQHLSGLIIDNREYVAVTEEVIELITEDDVNFGQYLSERVKPIQELTRTALGRYANTVLMDIDDIVSRDNLEQLEAKYGKLMQATDHGRLRHVLAVMVEEYTECRLLKDWVDSL